MTDRRGRPRDPHWIGRHGERIAASWLRSRRCRILARNFRPPQGGEVDIVARDGRLLLFVEVKTRRDGQRVRPLDAVDRTKQALIERGSRSWLRALQLKPAWRHDVIEVILRDGCKPEVRHIRNAF